MLNNAGVAHSLPGLHLFCQTRDQTDILSVAFILLLITDSYCQQDMSLKSTVTALAVQGTQIANHKAVCHYI